MTTCIVQGVTCSHKHHKVDSPNLKFYEVFEPYVAHCFGFMARLLFLSISVLSSAILTAETAVFSRLMTNSTKCQSYVKHDNYLAACRNV